VGTLPLAAISAVTEADLPGISLGNDVAFSPDGKTLTVAYSPSRPQPDPGKVQVRLWPVAALSGKSLLAP
jgi:hypothetical protein